MKENFEKLPLRNGVGVIILNSQNKVFVARRIDNPKKFWQMPQGGVEDGEDYYKAALRELKEETNIKSISLIKEIEGFISYNLPNNLLGIIWKGKYRGQKQKWFVMKFLGNPDEINVTGNPGDVFFYDSRLWHAVAENKGDGPRVAISVRYAPWWLNLNVQQDGHRDRQRIVLDIDGKDSITPRITRDTYNELPEKAKTLFMHLVES